MWVYVFMCVRVHACNGEVCGIGVCSTCSERVCRIHDLFPITVFHSTHLHSLSLGWLAHTLTKPGLASSHTH